MQDLKGKISTLQQRAKEDGMKRRSLQSLRTQSPFTAAEQWYTASSDYKPMLGNENDQPHIFGHHQARHDADMEDPQTVYDPDQENGDYYEGSVAQSYYEDADEQPQKDHEESYQDAEKKIRRDESVLDERDQRNGHPVQAVHDSRAQSNFDDFNEIEAELRPVEREDSTTPVGSRHEDREDAFDYQNFFLHSGMGNYSQSDLARRQSYSSTDSIETTRGVDYASNTNLPVVVPQRASNLPPHQRNMSTDTVSTVDSFATATEGLSSHRASDNEEEDEDEDEDGRYFHTPQPGQVSQPPISRSPQSPPQLEAQSSSLQPSRSTHNTPSPNRPPTAIQIHTPQKTTFTVASPQPSLDDPTPSARSFPLINRSKSAASFNTTSATSTHTLPRPDIAGLVNHLSGLSASPHNSIAFGHGYSQSTPHTAPLQSYASLVRNGIYSPTGPISRSGSAVSVATMSSFSTSASSTIGAHQQAQRPPQTLKAEDRALVERLVESLSEVCVALRSSGNGDGGSSSSGGVQSANREVEMEMWRVRLDGARRILDGEGADL
jgi:hypothetical protein